MSFRLRSVRVYYRFSTHTPLKASHNYFFPTFTSVDTIYLRQNTENSSIIDNSFLLVDETFELLAFTVYVHGLRSQRSQLPSINANIAFG